MYSTINSSYANNPNSFSQGNNQNYYNSIQTQNVTPYGNPYGNQNSQTFPVGNNQIYNSTIQSQNVPPCVKQKIPVMCREVVLHRSENAIFHPDKLELTVDVSGFRPEDVKCILKYNLIEIYAESYELSQNTQVKLIMHICHNLPQYVVPHLSSCGLTTSGHLILCAPWQF